MRPKRGSSGAWGTTSAGKFVVEAIAGEMWLAMLLSREREEEAEGEVEEEEVEEALEGDMVPRQESGGMFRIQWWGVALLAPRGKRRAGKREMVVQ